MSDDLKEFTYSEISEHSSKKVCTQKERGGVGIRSEKIDKLTPAGMFAFRTCLLSFTIRCIMLAALSMSIRTSHSRPIPQPPVAR